MTNRTRNTLTAGAVIAIVVGAGVLLALGDAEGARQLLGTLLGG